MVDVAVHQIPLQFHPSTPSDAIRGVDVRLSVPRPGVLALIYTLQADMSRIRVGSEVVPGRADGLWKHTCFEVFLQRGGSRGYDEFNFSPTRQWAAYRFDDYRQGMAPLDLPDPPDILARKTADDLKIQVVFTAVSSAAMDAAPRPRLALTAVVEEENGRLCYWSMRHPQGKPDFHHPDGFAFELPGPA
jgi:hypothetical protein